MLIGFDKFRCFEGEILVGFFLQQCMFAVYATGYGQNDKLKNFGLYIHGAMDTFSRRLLWLHIYTSNKDPRAIAHYYFKFTKEEKGRMIL